MSPHIPDDAISGRHRQDAMSLLPLALVIGGLVAVAVFVVGSTDPRAASAGAGHARVSLHAPAGVGRALGAIGHALKAGADKLRVDRAVVNPKLGQLPQLEPRSAAPTSSGVPLRQPASTRQAASLGTPSPRPEKAVESRSIPLPDGGGTAVTADLLVATEGTMELSAAAGLDGFAPTPKASAARPTGVPPGWAWLALGACVALGAVALAMTRPRAR